MITPEEYEAHLAFIAEMGPKALWISQEKP
jgi:hypothetical protein